MTSTFQILFYETICQAYWFLYQTLICSKYYTSVVYYVCMYVAALLLRILPGKLKGRKALYFGLVVCEYRPNEERCIVYTYISSEYTGVFLCTLTIVYYQYYNVVGSVLLAIVLYLLTFQSYKCEFLLLHSVILRRIIFF